MAFSARWLVLLVVLGCGRFRFDPLGQVIDGSNDSDGSGPDAFVAPCTSFGPWGTAQPVSELNTEKDDWGSTITANGLALYFQSDNVISDQILVARRNDRMSPFLTPVEDVVLEGDKITDPTITGDELELFADIDDGAGQCVHRITRQTTADAWSAPTPEASMCGAIKADCPFVSADGLTIFVEDTSPHTIAVATRASRSDAFGAFEPLANLNTGPSCPSARGDQLELFFDADGPANVWADERASAAAQFAGPGAAVPAAMSASSDEDSSITFDGLELFFSSDRPGGVGGFDLFHMTRVCN